MGALLKPTQTDGYVATRMQHPWATIEQGRIIACNAVTPMTSELPGFVKAKITYDVRSADGTTTLIDRNSDIFGEIGHGLAAGQDRLFVLWRSVLTPPPDLVRITLNSPAADELGEAGLPGDINNHMWRRIGGALLLSGVDTLLQGAGAGIGNALSHGNNSNGSSGSNLNFYQFQGQGSSLASALLQHTVEIPDTLHRDQALPCSIFVSGDLDFSSVYQLRRRGSAQ
jgi:type IV secretion system protein VirB10